ncbi:MAG: PhzF family phenazine biosynthesis protein [Acidovorax sp.]
MTSRPFKQVDVFTATAYRGNPLAVVLDGTGLSTAEMQHFTHWTHLSEATFALRPDAALLAGLDVGVAAPSLEDGIALEVRAFFPGNNGMVEDPVTGSLNAALAQWLIPAGLAPERYVACQGTALARAGLVHVEREGDRIWVGGDSVTCVDGEVLL